MFRILFTIAFLLSFQSFAGASKPPIFEDGDNSIKGTGYSTGCTDRDLERAHSRFHRDQILRARENPTPYAEFITFLLPRNRRQTVEVSNNGLDLLVNVGMRLGRCDELADGSYQPVIFPVSGEDGVIAFRRKGAFTGSASYEEKYSEQPLRLVQVGIAQLKMPLSEILDTDELFDLREGKLVDMELWVFHGVNRESESSSFGNLHDGRWIYSMDRNRNPSMTRLRRVDPFLLIRFQISMSADGLVKANGLRFGFETK